MNKDYFKISAFIVTLFIITLLLPSSHTFTFDIERGEVWNSEDLTAQFNFPLLKNKGEYEKDKEEAIERYIPIYSKVETISDKMLNQLAYDFDIELDNTDNLTQENQVKIALYNRLKGVYKRGVINIKEEQQQGNASTQLIRVVSNENIISTSKTNLYSLKSALDTLSVVAQQLEDVDDGIIGNYISANIIYDRELNHYERERLTSKVSRSKGFIPQGSLLISKGDVIDREREELLSSYKQEYELLSGGTSSYNVMIGNFILVFIILALSYTFIVNYRSQFARKRGNVFFLLFIYVFMTLLFHLVSKSNVLSFYLIPVAIVPFYIVTFYDIRMSIFEYASVLLLCSLFVPLPLEFFFINLFAGLAGIFTLQNNYNRHKFFSSVGIVLLVYIGGYLAFKLIETNDLERVQWIELLWFLGNILLLIALYQLIYIFEKLFKFVTNITLFELCDTNHPLLRTLAEKAPGTFQHSIQVANLAEAAAKEIGANHIYARAGALYHDIGKINNPRFFIENSSAESSPHKKLTPLESVEMIKKHISEGIALAKKHKLPSVIINFIPTHHAKSVIFYFYHQHTLLFPDREADKDLFRYDGPLPVTKEATICMMADSIEAASRSLKEYTTESISALVEKVVETQLKDGNFADSELKHSELNRVKELFKSKLTGMYHSRVEYPERKNEGEQ